MREEAREDTTGVPFLSRLPGIGAAFRYRDRAQDKTELIVFLRPTVVRDPALAGDLAKYPPLVAGRGRAGLDRHRRRQPASVVAAPAERRRTRPRGRRHCKPPRLRARDDPGRLRIDRSWAGNPADGLLGRAWAALARGDHRTARARLPPGAGRAPGGGASRPRRRRAPRGKAWGGPRVGTSVWPPSIRRTRSGGRYRSCSTAVRVRPPASGRLRGGPRSPRRRLGSRWRSETPSPIRASGRRRRTRIGRPAGRTFEPRPGVQLAVSADRRAPPPAGPGPLPRCAGARRPLAPRLRRACGPRAGRGARRAGPRHSRDRGEQPGPAAPPPPSGSPVSTTSGPFSSRPVRSAKDQARIALTEQSNTGARFADILAKLGFVTEAIIRDAVGGALGVESVDLGRTVAEPDAMAAVPEPVARRFLAVGLTLARDEGGVPRRLTVAMADPFDVIALDHLRSLFDGAVEIVRSSPAARTSNASGTRLPP